MRNICHTYSKGQNCKKVLGLGSPHSCWIASTGRVVILQFFLFKYNHLLLMILYFLQNLTLNVKYVLAFLDNFLDFSLYLSFCEEIVAIWVFKATFSFLKILSSTLYSLSLSFQETTLSLLIMTMFSSLGSSRRYILLLFLLVDASYVSGAICCLHFLNLFLFPRGFSGSSS